MSDDLPVYPDARLRRGNPYEDLDRAAGADHAASLERFDALLDLGEGAANVRQARELLAPVSAPLLAGIHRVLFEGAPAAGRLRGTPAAPPFPGQDCPDPQFLAAALDNLAGWARAPSFEEIHPLERAALVMTRLIDIWPFDEGNRTVAVLAANHYLLAAGYPPFFIQLEQAQEFDVVLAAAIRMQTEPLVRTIHRCLEGELRLGAV